MVLIFVAFLLVLMVLDIMRMKRNAVATSYEIASPVYFMPTMHLSRWPRMWSSTFVDQLMNEASWSLLCSWTM